MKKSMIHPVYREIVYEENIWTGKKSLTMGATALKKVGKNTFSMVRGGVETKVVVKGSVLSGVTLQIQREEIQIVPKATWYDWVLSVLPFVLIMIWGNNVQLCSILPVVGGAIGGLIGGLGMIVCRMLSLEKSIAGKLATALLVTAGSFGVAAAVGYAIAMMLL